MHVLMAVELESRGSSVGCHVVDNHNIVTSVASFLAARITCLLVLHCSTGAILHWSFLHDHFLAQIQTCPLTTASLQLAHDNHASETRDMKQLKKKYGIGYTGLRNMYRPLP